MKCFVIYDAGGAIRMQALGQEAPAVDGMTAMEIPGEVDITAHYVAAGVLTAYTDEQRATRAAPPHRRAAWSNTTMTWTDGRTTERAWADARARRDALLAASDWITVRAIEQGQAVPAPWAAYRQALRDITEQADPFGLTWPSLPA